MSGATDNFRSIVGWIFFFQAEDGIRDLIVTGVQTCALPISVADSDVNDGAIGNGCAWGDYNNDGFVDLFVANLNGQNNLLYRNDGNANNWLTIRCVGRLSNRSGIGAKVRLKTNIDGRSRWQMREISGG